MSSSRNEEEEESPVKKKNSENNEGKEGLGNWCEKLFDTHKNQDKRNDDIHEYTTGESDSEFEIPLQNLSKE